MKITVFTSNRPRHQALIARLSTVADRVFAVQECNTVFPGMVEDFFKKSEVMQDYFSRVLASEHRVFGDLKFSGSKVQTLSIKMGDLNRLSLSQLGEALNSDLYVVFGASYIKGPLVEHLVKNGCLNIHMGVSPQYRGSSTNFWALYDENPKYVGATIHMLTRGLDSGAILFHALPGVGQYAPFDLGMVSVDAAQRGLVENIANHRFGGLDAVPQNRALQLRYTRNRDFTDAIAADYLERLMSPEAIEAGLLQRDLGEFVHPFVL